VQLASIDQARQHRGRHGFAVGGDFEQRVAVDASPGAGDQFAGGALIDDVSIANDAERKARQMITRYNVIEDAVELRALRCLIFRVRS
jgi:hypothetical protein